MALLADAQMTVAAAPTTGAVTLGSATAGSQSWAAAGALNGSSYSYRIDDTLGNWEIGTGVYASSGPALSRTTVMASSNSNALVNFGADAIVSSVLLPGDFQFPYRNRLINANFAINQRGVASASTAYSAGAYVMDRWKAGGSGCTLSFATAANGDTTLTITAGTLMQVIEGALYLPEGGGYVLSWSGSATARVYQGSASGSYAASPVAATGLTGGTNTTVEFGTGTLGLVQFEPGATPSLFERRGAVERLLAQRYYQIGQTYLYGQSYGAGASLSTPARLVPMQASPTVTISGITSSGMNAPNVSVLSNQDVLFYGTSTTTSGAVYYQFNWTASAEL